MQCTGVLRWDGLHNSAWFTPRHTHPFTQDPPGSGIYNTTWLLPLPGYWDTHPASAGGTVPNRANHLHVYTGRNFTRMARRVSLAFAFFAHVPAAWWWHMDLCSPPLLPLHTHLQHRSSASRAAAPALALLAST